MAKSKKPRGVFARTFKSKKAAAAFAAREGKRRGAVVTIGARRDSRGRFSKTGKVFSFHTTFKAPKGAKRSTRPPRGVTPKKAGAGRRQVPSRPRVPRDLIRPRRRMPLAGPQRPRNRTMRPRVTPGPSRQSRTGSRPSRPRKASKITKSKAARTTARTSSHDPLQVQLSYKIHGPAGVEIGGNLLREALAYKLKTGQSPPGIELSIVQWRNPRRNDPKLREWRSGPQGEAWETLGNALRGYLDQIGESEVAISAVRRS